VSREDGVVGLYDGGGDLRGRVDGEFELGLLSVIDRQTLHEEGGETGAGASAERVEDQETLKSRALIGELADSVEYDVDDFLADGVVASGVVVGRVLLAGDELLRVEELTVCSGADLVDYGGFQVDEYCTRNVFAGSSFAEEGVETVVATAHGLVGRHLTVRLDAMLQAVKLPAGISNLDSGLANVDRDTLTHFDRSFLSSLLKIGGDEAFLWICGERNVE